MLFFFTLKKVSLDASKWYSVSLGKQNPVKVKLFGKGKIVIVCD